MAFWRFLETLVFIKFSTDKIKWDILKLKEGQYFFPFKKKILSTFTITIIFFNPTIR
jgi:hypothetical protein